MKRPSQDKYFMSMAMLAATRSNCYRRQVGCVIIDKENRVLATGYNGVPSGYPHCEIGECPRDKPGADLHLCLAIHAEQNALLQCSDVDKIHKVYVTDSPCLTCTVMLMNTNCKQILYNKPYPGHETSKDAWKKLNRIWRQYDFRSSTIIPN